jgi:hypothetical protein
VIPVAEDVLAEYEAWSGDLDLREKRALLAELLAEARALQLEPAEEPAALFFVFCQHWMRLGEHCTHLIDWIAIRQIERLGLPVTLDPRALRELRLDTCARWATLEDVRTWFSSQYARQLD